MLKNRVGCANFEIMIFEAEKKIWIAVAIFISAGFFVFPVRLDAVGEVVINEIAWMGTTADYNNEWIELYNNADYPIDISDWTLRGQDGTPLITLVGTIAAHDFFILERSDDETLPNIAADQIYTGALGNSGENLELKDNSGNLIDLVDCVSGWFGGVIAAKQTMERKNPQFDGNNPANWGTSHNSGGTPKAQNSVFQSGEPTPTLTPDSTSSPQATPTPTPTPIPTLTPTLTPVPSQTPLPTPALTSTPTPVSSPTPTPHPVYSRSVVINEFLPDPAGDDAEGEWVEVFNKESEPVDLAGWKLADKTSKFTIPQNTVIGAKSFLVFSRPTTKLSINNDGEILSLIDPSGELAFKVSYEDKAPEGQTWARQLDGQWVWSSRPTPGSQNIIKTKTAESSKASKSVSAPAREETVGLAADENQVSDSGAASIGSFRRNYKIAGIAVLLGLFSVAGILILKKFST